jgi:PPP family 3-phenylpropionic acid transporter
MSLRLATAYVAVFLYVGMFLPFWPVWLASRAMDPDRIGLLLGIGTWACAWAPWVGARADGSDPRRWTTGLAAALTVTLVGFGWATGFPALLGLSILLGLAFAPIVPLTDGLTLHAMGQRRVDYGRVRLFGSLAFILASVGGGVALEGRAPAVILTTMQVLAVVVLASTLVLPRASPRTSTRAPLRWRELVRRPGFGLLLGTGACLQGAHAVLYGFGTKHWLAAGIDAGTIGGLWAIGVIAEIVLFAVGERVIARIGAHGLLVASAIGHIVRWTLLANVTDAAALFAIQILHGATFGALHLGAMHWIRSSIGPEAVQRATTLYAAVASGLALGAALIAAGVLYERIEGAAFYAMACLGALGLLFALRLRRTEAVVPG